MSKPIPPKEQPRQGSSRGGTSQAASSKTPAAGGPARNETRSPAPQVSRPKVIEPQGILEEQIALRAYEIWEARGRPEGTDFENWVEAERQLRQQIGSAGRSMPVRH